MRDIDHEIFMEKLNKRAEMDGYEMDTSDMSEVIAQAETDPTITFQK